MLFRQTGWSLLKPFGLASVIVAAGAVLYVMLRLLEDGHSPVAPAGLLVGVLFVPPLVLCAMELIARLCSAASGSNSPGDVDQLLQRKREGALRHGVRRYRDSAARTDGEVPDTRSTAFRLGQGSKSLTNRLPSSLPSITTGIVSVRPKS